MQFFVVIHEPIERYIVQLTLMFSNNKINFYININLLANTYSQVKQWQ